MAENLSSLEPWFRGPPFTEGLWMSDAFPRDTDMITRALQMSIASSCSSPEYSSSHPPTPTPSPLPFLTHEQPTSDSDSGSRKKMAAVVPGPSGKISKRKSRVSKRPPTTFITADPANFRQMVQQVTGVSLGDEAVAVDTDFTKPAPQRSAVGCGGGSNGSRVVIPQSCLPTLDTSAFLLGREGPPPTVMEQQQQQQQQKNQQMFPVVDAGVGHFDFDAAAASFPCFPTLESWGVM